MGGQLELRDGWDEIKFDVMHRILRSKFSNPQLAQQLLDTGNCHLVEGNVWDDTIWGMAVINDQLRGTNKLGEALMQIRSELRSKGVDKCRLIWESEADLA